MSSKKAAKILIVDGIAFCYRSYYAITSLSNSKGEATNAIYGFVSIMRKLIQDSQPDYVAMCFDLKEPTFRHEKFDSYKAHRKPMPDDLVDQIEPIKEFCRLSNYAIFEKAGYEADDVIGTLAVEGAKKGLEVFIVTGDKDAMQLVNERVKILNPHKNNLVIDIAGVKKRYEGLGPEKVIDIMSLMGDSSDNIPGVRGIGEKTAVKLIHQFGSLEDLLNQVDKVKSKSQRALIQEHAQAAKDSKYLVTIDTKVPIKVDWEKLKLQEPKQKGLREFYQRYEFRGFLKELSPAGEAKQEKRDYKIVDTEKKFKAFLDELKRVKSFSFDTETTSEDPMRAELVGMSFSWKALQAYYLPVVFPDGGREGLDGAKAVAAVKPFLEDPDQKKFGQNIKYDWIMMRRYGVAIQGIQLDTMVASYLVNPIKLNHNLDDISLEHLGVNKISTKSLLGTGKSKITMAEVPIAKVAEYACEDADCVFRLAPILEKELKARKLTKLFKGIELPLIEVLAKVEMNGVQVDRKFLADFSSEAGKELDKLTTAITDEAGQEFNLNSPKQLSEVLFEKLKLPVIKKTKTGYSTDVSVLEKLAAEHEIPKKILEYREKQKLKSTYLDALPEMVNPKTDLIHTSYNQTTTSTGRLSSSDPNLQNIPIRTEAGRRIRKAFVPRGKKNKLLSADYSQIELRILAHLSGDKNLTKAFKEDRDIHTFTATLLYGMNEEDVSREMRDLAKVVNFSIIYGKTAYGLSQDLGISVPEADGFIQNYFKRYKSVKDYLESEKEKARTDGFLVTIFDRRSYFPGINSRNMHERNFAERAAINAPIQGSAADLIKIAMIRIQEELESTEMQSVMIMQVHDELVFDVPQDEVDVLSEMVRKAMEGAAKLQVPLKVDQFIGDSWFKG